MPPSSSSTTLLPAAAATSASSNTGREGGEETIDKKPAAVVTGTDSNSTANTNINSNSNIYVSAHPVLYHKITVLRSSTTCPGTFRSVLREVTYNLGYEATKNLKVKGGLPVTVPLGKESDPKHEELRSSFSGYKLIDKVAMIPILRSGLGMTDPMLELLPNSAVHHIGMYKTSGNSVVQYFNRLPRGKCASDIAYVLDPCIGSAATILAVISILKKWGVPKIHVITVLASQQGLDIVSKKHPDVHVTVGMVDTILTEEGIVLPGMGDVGDRLFGTGNHDFIHGGGGASADDNNSSVIDNETGSVAAGAGACGDNNGSMNSGGSNNSITATTNAKRRKRSSSLELEMENNK